MTTEDWDNLVNLTPTDLDVLSYLKTQGVLGIFGQFRSGFLKFYLYTLKL